MSEIKFILNGEEKTLPNKTTIADLVLQYNLDIKKVAIEKDLQVINPEMFTETLVEDGSKIEIVHFIGGG